MHVFDASVAYDYDSAKAGTISAVGYASSVSSGTIFQAAGSTPDSYAANETVSLYMVIYDAATIADAKNYIVSDEKTVKIAASGANQSMAFGNMAGTTTANMFLGASWQATQSIPEPTSGLLLLLGMAGLALRRKQA